jgi:hypothetical protein
MEWGREEGWREGGSEGRREGGRKNLWAASLSSLKAPCSEAAGPGAVEQQVRAQRARQVGARHSSATEITICSESSVLSSGKLEAA